MNTGGEKRCVDAGIPIGLVRVHGFRVRGDAAPRNDNRSTDPRASANQDLRLSPCNNSILCEKSSGKTATEQRDNSEKTAARNGEQRTAPQAELEIAIAENPVMRSIWERFVTRQEQKENDFRQRNSRDCPIRLLRRPHREISAADARSMISPSSSSALLPLTS
jgi:hypothetical protein